MRRRPRKPVRLEARARRRVAITQVMLRVPSPAPRGAVWEGPLSEAQAQRLLRRLLARAVGRGLLWMWLTLEDCTQVLATPEWTPGRRPDVRRLAAASLAPMAASRRLPPAACAEAKRVLGLLAAT
ncbi:MAG: hypothetical protein QOI63_135 [Thermoplasmata archaeon]|nr:hypothetical protein [Thermoplasmata archaeon]